MKPFDPRLKIIYNGGHIPTLGVQNDPESPWYGWMFYKHPDGQWVSLADISDVFTQPENNERTKDETI